VTLGEVGRWERRACPRVENPEAENLEVENPAEAPQGMEVDRRFRPLGLGQRQSHQKRGGHQRMEVRQRMEAR